MGYNLWYLNVWLVHMFCIFLVSQSSNLLRIRCQNFPELGSLAGIKTGALLWRIRLWSVTLKFLEKLLDNFSLRA